MYKQKSRNFCCPGFKCQSGNAASTTLFSNHITKVIEQNGAYAASKMSVKDTIMVGNCCTKDVYQNSLLSNQSHHKEQDSNSVISAEAMMLLELIQPVERKQRHVVRGRIIIGFDNKNTYRRIVKEIFKLSIYL